jgi:hypothetical protein
MTAASNLTFVDLLHIEGQVQRWVRFGRASAEQIIDRRARRLGFAPGQMFAFVRWRANAHGTAESRIDILRAPRPGEAFTVLPHIHPGGVSLLRLSGWPKVAEVLAAIDAVEALNIDPCDVCPSYWQHVHNQLLSGRSPRSYTRARHAAWRLRRSLEP